MSCFKQSVNCYRIKIKLLKLIKIVWFRYLIFFVTNLIIDISYKNIILSHIKNIILSTESFSYLINRLFEFI